MPEYPVIYRHVHLGRAICKDMMETTICLCGQHNMLFSPTQSCTATKRKRIVWREGRPTNSRAMKLPVT